MKNNIQFNLARGVALMSLLWAPFVSLLSQPVAAVGGFPPASDEGGSGGDPYGIAATFWQEAWGRPFVPDESGLELLEEVGPDLWRVSVLADENGDGIPEPVDEGLYFEFGRVGSGFAVDADQGELIEDGVLAIEVELSSGVILGSTGYTANIVAMVIFYLLVPGQEQATIQTLAPGVVTPDAESAWELMHVLSGMHDIGPDTYVGDLDDPLFDDPMPVSAPGGPPGLHTNQEWSGEGPWQPAQAPHDCLVCFTPCPDCGPPPSNPCDDFLDAIQPCVTSLLVDVGLAIGTLWGVCANCRNFIGNFPVWKACVASCGVALSLLALKALYDFLRCVRNIWRYLQQVCGAGPPSNDYPPFTPPGDDDDG